MENSLIPRRDIDFLLYDWLKPSLEGHDRETVSAVLDLSEKLAADCFLPHYKLSDQNEPSLTGGKVEILPAIGEALKSYAEAGLFAAGFSESLGGLGLPYLISAISFAQFAAANIATAAYPLLTTANARLIAAFGTPAQIEHFARPQIDGRWFGTMCLSEPQAGSSLADIRTRAVFDGEDENGPRYRLAGNKMWISGGDQDVSENIVHLVLAKIPGPDGALVEYTMGISLFIVPKLMADGSVNDIAVAGLNHKMGYRGTANCVLNFGEGGGATGWLIGSPGQGLAQMFHMMNEARIGVGIGAAALGYRSYRLALQYAQERTQGRPVGRRGGSPSAIIEHADVKRMLLAQKAYAEGSFALCIFCANLVDAEHDAESAALLALLTPVAKTWPSEYGLAANDLAIQIYGGYGYTREFDVEQLYRDNRLNPIHEGTTGIQAIDLLGRKILRDKGVALAIAQKRLEATCADAHAAENLKGFADQLSQRWMQLTTTVDLLREVDPARVFDNATAFLWGFGHIVVAWLWLDQAVAAHRASEAGTGEANFLQGKLRACRFFFEFELPKAGLWLDTVASQTDVASSALPEQF